MQAAMALCCTIFSAACLAAPRSEAGPSQVESAQGMMRSGERAFIELGAKRGGLTDFKLRSSTGPSGRLVLDGFSAGLGGGRVEATGRIDFGDSRGPQRLRVKLTGVDGAALLKSFDFKLDARVSARVDALVDVAWTGLGRPKAKRTMTGSASFSTGPGTVQGADFLDEAARLAGNPALARLDFAKASGQARFGGGTMTVNDLRFTGPTQQVSGTGRLELPDSRANFNLSVKMVPAGGNGPATDVPGTLTLQGKLDRLKARWTAPATAGGIAAR